MATDQEQPHSSDPSIGRLDCEISQSWFTRESMNKSQSNFSNARLATSIRRRGCLLAKLKCSHQKWRANIEEQNVNGRSRAVSSSHNSAQLTIFNWNITFLFLITDPTIHINVDPIFFKKIGNCSRTWCSAIARAFARYHCEQKWDPADLDCYLLFWLLQRRLLWHKWLPTFHCSFWQMINLMMFHIESWEPRQQRTNTEKSQRTLVPM